METGQSGREIQGESRYKDIEVRKWKECDGLYGGRGTWRPARRVTMIVQDSYVLQRPAVSKQDLAIWLTNEEAEVVSRRIAPSGGDKPREEDGS